MERSSPGRRLYPGSDHTRDVHDVTYSRYIENMKMTHNLYINSLDYSLSNDLEPFFPGKFLKNLGSGSVKLFLIITAY